MKIQHLTREKRCTCQDLLVEDNEVNQMVARHILEEASHLITIANNGY